MGVRTFLGFWTVLALALLAPLAAHYCQSAPDRDAAETACLNAASSAIFRWHQAGEIRYTRTLTGATASIHIVATEWTRLSRPQQAAVCTLLRRVVWHGGQVNRCLVQDECGATLASG